MNVEQLHLVLPVPSQDPAVQGLSVNQLSSLLEQFAAQGGREALLGGPEPLANPGFHVLVRRGLKAGLPRVTAYLNGSLLEPWVLRGLVESGVHVLITLDSLQPGPHDAVHGAGSHGRAMAAIELFLKQGLSQRVGILATATRLNREELPMLAAWAVGKGLSRFMWTFVPETGWPSQQLRALGLGVGEREALAAGMHSVVRSAPATYVGALDMADDISISLGYSPIVRVGARGEASWGFFGEGGPLGDLRHTSLTELLARSVRHRAAGD